MNPARQHRSPLIAAVSVVALLAGCGAANLGNPPAEPTLPAASPSTTPTADPASTIPAPTPSTAADVTADLTITGGTVDTIQTIRVKEGQTVTINAVSDTADSLHVHGYDLTVDVEPDKPASTTFTADVQGVFEIETHDGGKLVAKLVVS